MGQQIDRPKDDATRVDPAVFRRSPPSRSGSIVTVDYDPLFGGGPNPTTPLTSEQTRDLATTVCRTPDGDPARNPLNIKVYREFQQTICTEAIRFNISQQLLAITLQHEGSGRMAYVFHDIGPWNNPEPRRGVELLAPGDTVGIGQINPNTAIKMSEWADGEAGLTYDEARRRLVYDDRWAIHVAAARLRYLQERYYLSDKQAFITYAFDEEKDLGDLWATDFAGRQSAPRGDRYEELRREVDSYLGYGDSVGTPNIPPSRTTPDLFS